MKTQTHEECTGDFFRIIRSLDIVQGAGDHAIADQWDVRYVMKVLHFFGCSVHAVCTVGTCDTGYSPLWAKYLLPHTVLTLRGGCVVSCRAVRENAPYESNRKWHRFTFRVYLDDLEYASQLPDRGYFLRREELQRDENGGSFVPYWCYNSNAARDYAREKISLDSIRAG